MLRNRLDPLASERRKEMMPAPRAAETRHSQGTPHKRKFPLAVFGGDALHVKIPAVAAVCRKHKANRDHPSVETLIACGTTPRAQSGQADSIVKRALAA
jgi:hypothetical protein